VVLVSTCNPDWTPNLAPLSAVWALGWTVVLGLPRQGQTSATSSAPANAFSIFLPRISAHLQFPPLFRPRPGAGALVPRDDALSGQRSRSHGAKRV